MTLTISSPVLAVPRWATRRRLERETLGPRVAAIAGELGCALMPWQQLVADVGLELRDGLPAYREVWVSVPRQNGKTTLVLAWELDRALYWGPRQRIVYSAQTGQDARRKLLEDQVPILKGSPFWPLIGDGRVRRAAGSEGVSFKNGSRVDVLANSQASGHGRTLDLGVIDEAFDDVDDRREQAIAPAQITKPEAQIFGCSTMGTDASIYLNRKVDAGRSVAAADRDDATIAYFEWSAPTDADIEDPAVWGRCNPALGYTISEAVMRHEYQTMQEGDFRRAHLNQRTQSEERVIPIAVWDAACSDEVTPDGQVCFMVDCTPERTHASIAVADPLGNVELVDHERGTGWCVGRAAQLARRWSASVAYDPAGPAAPFVPELEQAGVTLIQVGGREMAAACGLFYDGIADRTTHIKRHPALDAAVGAASKRVVGDTWVWARKDNVTPISPLVAATGAHWAARQTVTSGYYSRSELQ